MEDTSHVLIICTIVCCMSLNPDEGNHVYYHLHEENTRMMENTCPMKTHEEYLHDSGTTEIDFGDHLCFLVNVNIAGISGKLVN